MCSFHIVEVIFSQGGISCQWDYLYCDPIMFSSLLPQLKRDPGALWDFGARSPKMVFLNKSTRTEEAWVKEGSLTGDTSIFLLSGAIVLTGATSVSDCWNCSVTKADDCSFRIILEFPSTSKKKKTLLTSSEQNKAAQFVCCQTADLFSPSFSAALSSKPPSSLSSVQRKMSNTLVGGNWTHFLSLLL